MREFGLVLCCTAAVLLAACGRGPAQAGNRAAGGMSDAANTNANVSPAQALASGQLDADIAQLEAQAETQPEDDTARTAVAAAYVRRANALRAAGRTPDAMRDYQTALRFNPDNEDAQLGLEQLNQEAGAAPRADDGQPVTVPAKKP